MGSIPGTTHIDTKKKNVASRSSYCCPCCREENTKPQRDKKLGGAHSYVSGPSWVWEPDLLATENHQAWPVQRIPHGLQRGSSCVTDAKGTGSVWTQLSTGLGLEFSEAPAPRSVLLTPFLVMTAQLCSALQARAPARLGHSLCLTPTFANSAGPPGQPLPLIYHPQTAITVLKGSSGGAICLPTKSPGDSHGRKENTPTFPHWRSPLTVLRPLGHGGTDAILHLSRVRTQLCPCSCHVSCLAGLSAPDISFGKMSSFLPNPNVTCVFPVVSPVCLPSLQTAELGEEGNGKGNDDTLCQALSQGLVTL